MFLKRNIVHRRSTLAIEDDVRVITEAVQARF